MPCRSYDNDNHSSEVTRLVKLNDKLARIACKALQQIEDSPDGGLEFLVLKDPEVRDWWTAHKEADRKAAAAEAERMRKYKEAEGLKARKKAIIEKLTAEELKILGVK